MIIKLTNKKMVARKPRPWLDTFRYCRVTEATQKHFLVQSAAEFETDGFPKLT